MKSLQEFLNQQIPSLLILQGEHSNPTVNETHIDDWYDLDDNTHLGSDLDSQIGKLHRLHQISDEDRVHLKRYTTASRNLNTTLYNNHKAGIYSEGVIDRHSLYGLDRATSRPIQTNLSVYSGLKYDPEPEIKRAKRMTNGVIHLPAYTSTSLDKGVAEQYAIPSGYGRSKTLHIFHFHLDPEDNGVFLGRRHSVHPSESELLLPRNTKIHIDGEEEHDANPLKLKIWHVKALKTPSSKR